jgi:hypothetical protein
MKSDRDRRADLPRRDVDDVDVRLAAIGDEERLSVTREDERRRMRADVNLRDDALGGGIDEGDLVAEIGGDGERSVRAARDRGGIERQRERDVFVDAAARGVDVRDLLLERPRDRDPHAVAVLVPERSAVRSVEVDAPQLAQRRRVEDAEHGLAMTGLELEQLRSVVRENEPGRERPDGGEGTGRAADPPAGRQRREQRCGGGRGTHRERAGDRDERGPFHEVLRDVRARLRKCGDANRARARGRAARGRRRARA